MPVFDLVLRHFIAIHNCSSCHGAMDADQQTKGSSKLLRWTADDEDNVCPGSLSLQRRLRYPCYFVDSYWTNLAFGL